MCSCQRRAIYRARIHGDCAECFASASKCRRSTCQLRITCFSSGWFYGAVFRLGWLPSVRPCVEMSFRNARDVPKNGELLGLAEILEAGKSPTAEFIHFLISLTTIESLGRISTFAFPNLSPTVIRIKLRFCGQTYVYSAPAVYKSATGKKRVCRCPHELHSNSIVAATIHHPLRRNLSQSGKHERN